jgi:hypothetical protein
MRVCAAESVQGLMRSVQECKGHRCVVIGLDIAGHPRDVMTTAARNDTRKGMSPSQFYRKSAAIPDTQAARGCRVGIAFMHFD